VRLLADLDPFQNILSSSGPTPLYCFFFLCAGRASHKSVVLSSAVRFSSFHGISGLGVGEQTPHKRTLDPFFATNNDLLAFFPDLTSVPAYLSNVQVIFTSKRSFYTELLPFQYVVFSPQASYDTPSLQVRHGPPAQYELSPGALSLFLLFLSLPSRLLTPFPHGAERLEIQSDKPSPTPRAHSALPPFRPDPLIRPRMS